MANSYMWRVYIIQTKCGKLYTGITNDLNRRFEEHKNQKKNRKGARFFNFSDPEKIIYSECHLNRSEASKREAAIKKMRRKDKLSLIRTTDGEIKN